MCAINKLLLAFLVTVFGVCDASSAVNPYDLSPCTSAVRKPFIKPQNKRGPGADSPLAPKSPSITPATSSVSCEERGPTFKRARGDGSPDGSTASSEDVGLIRATAGSPALPAPALPGAAAPDPAINVAAPAPELAVEDAPVPAHAVVPPPALAPKPTIHHSGVLTEAQKKNLAQRKAALATVPAPAPRTIPAVSAEWLENTKCNFQTTEAGRGRGLAATVFNDELLGLGAYLSHEAIQVAGEKYLEATGEEIEAFVDGKFTFQYVEKSPWDRKAILLKGFKSFKEGQILIENLAKKLSISLKQKPSAL